MKMSIFDRVAERILSCPAAGRLYSEKVKKELRLLHPAKETGQVCHAYYREKISFLLKTWAVGAVIVFLMYAVQNAETLLHDGKELDRTETGRQEIALTVYDEEMQEAEIVYEVQGLTLTKEEIQVQAERFLDEYENLICGENESLQNVHTDLLLQTAYDTYPLEFSWESSDYRIVGEDGSVGNEELIKEQTVQLTVVMSYGKEEYTHTFSVQVVPVPLTKAQKWQKEILAAIAAEDERQKYETEFQLPSIIAGKQVTYEEKKDTSAGLFCLLLAVVSIALFFLKDRDLEKEMQLRKKNMSMKYPEFVSKFQLLLGAGMTVRNIFIRLSKDKALGKELTEEMELVVRDLKNGISVRDALDRFGKRTANPLYIKFSALLIQNMKKGTDDLTEQLSKEAAEAFVLRKTNARRLGEEAGTKLLGPMILMLGIVMAILMIPAFLSFQL